MEAADLQTLEGLGCRHTSRIDVPPLASRNTATIFFTVNRLRFTGPPPRPAQSHPQLATWPRFQGAAPTDGRTAAPPILKTASRRMIEQSRRYSR